MILHGSVAFFLGLGFMADQAPIIIKRKKVIQGGGHHGGAWKVAYADFVTAMMAFFLLMWLLNATTEEQRKGIADYFNPTIPVAAVSGGGTDALNGDSVLTEDTLSASADYQSRPGKKGEIPSEEELKEQISGLAEEAGIADAENRVRVKETDEGTVIELVDATGLPLFDLGSATASDDLKALISATAKVVTETGADIKITGHTDGQVYATEGYSNWELSADRANIARRLLIEAGVGADRIVEVAGKADREPIAEDRNAPVNRRIAIVLRKNNGSKDHAAEATAQHSAGNHQIPKSAPVLESHFEGHGLDGHSDDEANGSHGPAQESHH